MNNGFSILICSWNNLSYLKTTIDSIKKNSVFEHQILVHVQEGTDGTLEWLKDNSIQHTFSRENIGICSGFNTIEKSATKDWICMLDDDMYLLPEWDSKIYEFYISNNMSDCSWLSSTMIERTNTSFASVIPFQDYGGHPEKFNEKELLINYKKISENQNHINHNSTHPLVIKKEYFDKAGGYDTDFDPSPGSEEGFAKRMFDIGCRDFVAIKDSLVYHFGSITNRKKNNLIKKNSRHTFISNYGITMDEFFIEIDKNGIWKPKNN